MKVKLKNYAEIINLTIPKTIVFKMTDKEFSNIINSSPLIKDFFNAIIERDNSDSSIPNKAEYDELHSSNLELAKTQLDTGIIKDKIYFINLPSVEVLPIKKSSISKDDSIYVQIVKELRQLGAIVTNVEYVSNIDRVLWNTLAPSNIVGLVNKDILVRLVDSWVVIPNKFKDISKDIALTISKSLNEHLSTLAYYYTFEELKEYLIKQKQQKNNIQNTNSDLSESNICDDISNKNQFGVFPLLKHFDEKYYILEQNNVVIKELENAGIKSNVFYIGDMVKCAGVGSLFAAVSYAGIIEPSSGEQVTLVRVKNGWCPFPVGKFNICDKKDVLDYIANATILTTENDLSDWFKKYKE